MMVRTRARFLLLAILPLLLSLGLIALAMRQQQQDLSRRERQVVENAIMAAKEVELLNRVNQARSALAPYARYGRSTSSGAATSTGVQRSARPAAPRSGTPLVRVTTSSHFGFMARAWSLLSGWPGLNSPHIF